MSLKRAQRQERRATLVERAGYAAAKEMPAIVAAMMSMIEDKEAEPRDRMEAAKLVMKIATEARLEEQRQTGADVHQHLHLEAKQADAEWHAKVQALVAKAQRVPMIVEGAPVNGNGNGNGRG